jgi:hypothetical protein
MLFGETVTVYCDNHTEQTVTLYGQIAEFQYVRADGTYRYHCIIKINYFDGINMFRMWKPKNVCKFSRKKQEFSGRHFSGQGTFYSLGTQLPDNTK